MITRTAFISFMMALLAILAFASAVVEDSPNPLGLRGSGARKGFEEMDNGPVVAAQEAETQVEAKEIGNLRVRDLTRRYGRGGYGYGGRGGGRYGYHKGHYRHWPYYYKKKWYKHHKKHHRGDYYWKKHHRGHHNKKHYYGGYKKKKYGYGGYGHGRWDD